MDATTEATAYHEAGHAVVALALGRPVQEVTIVPDRLRLGTCEFRKPVFRPTEDWLEREILISLAGMAAEARHTGEYARDAALHDLQYTARLTAQRAGGPRQAERLERRLLAKVEYLLAREENWRAVEAIAADLLRLKTLSGRAVRHLFEQARGAR